MGEGAVGPPPNAGVTGEPADAGLLGRETKGEVVLVGRLRAAFEKLNPTLPPEAIAAAISVIRPVSSAGEMAVLSEIAWPMVGAIPCLLFYLKQPFYCSVKHSD